jgi:hypothetical protein
MRIAAALMAGAALLTACASGLSPRAAPEPEVWLLMGQSNMSGRGLLAELPPGWNTRDPRIQLLGNDGVVRPAVEPLDSSEGQIDAVSADAAAAVGPGLAFARARLEADPDRRILLVPCAKGGTAIAEWTPAADRSTLFGSCVARAREAKARGRLRGALWYQGESDTRTAEAATGWSGRFEAMLSAFRAAVAQPNLPVIVVSLGDPPETGEYAGRYPHWETVRFAQNALRLDHVRVVLARGLPRNPDRLHLSTAGQLTLGLRLADAAETLVPVRP